MGSSIRIVDGVSKWIRKSVGAEAGKRGDDADDATDSTEEANGEADDATGESPAEDDDRASSDYDSPACCSAASSTDVTVFDE